MSNRSISDRILEAVEAFEVGNLSAFMVNESIEVHSPAFEGVPRILIDKLNEAGHTLLSEDISDFEREGLGWPSRTVENIRNVKEALHAIVSWA